ncbi:GspE/PulE family protein [Candidatus Kaiserbacteria bacterium]|nr:GspE/PulE family protein [Candidatus Kaiserbacteria bacterium]
MNILTLLQQKGVLDATAFERVERAIETENITAEAAVLKEGVTPQVVRDTLAAYHELPTREIPENTELSEEAMQYIPEESARHYRMAPLGVEEGVLIVGVVDPDDYGLRDALNFISARHQLPYRLEVILEQDLDHALASYENLTGEVGEALESLDVNLDADTEDTIEKTDDEIEHIKEDAPVTKIVATILRYAVDGGASDIHVEPYEERVIVRFRVDGVLIRSLELPKKLHSAVVARVKILAALRLDEKRKPQDGRFSATIDRRKIDFRVSVLPTNHGEKVVMRILDTEAGVRSLEGTGVSKHNIALIRKALKQPFGIILISGPTGSGKSTTLYAMLNEVDKAGKNVLSLEDPVEYNIDGVSQSQVRPEIGYTFAAGLRAALRQDPDIIMVGEIRDKETAQLAVQAALTGHIVLSTIHTNNAIGVVPRLVDMGVDPYLIAPTLQLALAQRLVRRVCKESAKEVPVSESMQEFIDQEFADVDQQYKNVIPRPQNVLQAQASKECPNGTRGRIAVMEAMSVNDELEQLILEGAPEEKLYEVARKNGFISMKEDALIKALNHDISFEEVSQLGGELMIAQEEADEDLAPEAPPVTDTPATPPEQALPVENPDTPA